MTTTNETEPGQPGNHTLPSDDSELKHYSFKIVLLTCPESKNREMQGGYDFQPFFWLFAAAVERSQLRNENSNLAVTLGHSKQL